MFEEEILDIVKRMKSRKHSQIKDVELLAEILMEKARMNSANK